MAEKKQQKDANKDQKAEPKKALKAAAEKEGKSKVNGRIIIVAVIVIIIVAAGLYFLLYHAVNSVPFQTFKSYFNSASNVSVTITYSNITQSSSMVPCSSLIIEAIAHMRKPATIDFFQINLANDTCVYQRSLGQAQPRSANASYCEGAAHSEPTIFLNYSQTNSTLITQSSLYVYGNSAYMLSCPVEIELS